MNLSDGKRADLFPAIGSAGRDADYSLSSENFERFRRLISQASGIFFDRGREPELKQGLADRARSIGVLTLDEYFEQITTRPDREIELGNLLDRLSVTQTQFFRNMPQFDSLRKYIVPEIIGRKAAGHRVIRCWSAGCATGQEPYSLAMSILDVMPDTNGWKIQILGTDLNERALDTARSGWYPESLLSGIDRRHLENYFRAHDGGYKVVEPVRRMVDFQKHNLVRDSLPVPSFGTCDVVFCRNVIIYFKHDTARYVIDHFFDILNPGGYLFLGHSETLWKMSARYSLIEMGDTFIYRKPLPMSLNGRRFIPDRRMRDGELPPGVGQDRRRADRDRRKRVAGESPSYSWKLSEEIASDGSDKTEEIAMIQRLLDLGEYESATARLEELLDKDACARTYFLMGLAREKSGDLKRAAEEYTTMGEICESLRQVFGEYHDPAYI